MAQIEAEATTVGPVTVEIHPSDDPAFEKAVQWAISEDDGDVAGAVKRVGDKLHAIYPNVKVQLNAREDGFGPREWKVRRE